MYKGWSQIRNELVHRVATALFKAGKDAVEDRTEHVHEVLEPRPFGPDKAT